MNREMRRLQGREERLQKRQESGRDRAARRAAAIQARAHGERKPIWTRLRDYLHEVRQELRKVTWPTREQLIAFTVVTVIATITLTGVVFGFDFVMKELVFYLVARS